MKVSEIRRIWETWDEIAAIEETAVSRDGYVTATVNANGELRALKLDPRLYRRTDSTTLADAIITTITEATKHAQRRAFATMAPLLPNNASFAKTDLALDPIAHHLEGER